VIAPSKLLVPDIVLDRAADGRSVGLPLDNPEATPATQPTKRPWRSLLVTADALSLSVSFAVGALARQALGSGDGPSFSLSLLHELPLVPLYLLAIAAYGLYGRDRRRLRSTSFMDIASWAHALALAAIGTLVVSAIAFRQAGTSRISWVDVVFMSLPAILLVPLGRAAASAALRRRGALKSRVILLGSGSVAASLARRLEHCPDTELVGLVDDEPKAAGNLPCRWLGKIADLPAVCAAVGADRVIVAFSQSSPTWVVEILRGLAPSVRISVVPRLFELVTWQSQIEEINGLTIMDLAPPQLGPVSRFTKRALDISTSAILILVNLPLIVLTAIATKVTSPGPVLFRQDRVGRDGKVFQIFKFRTMAVGADEVKIDLREQNDADGPLFKLRNDPRVTRFGRFLRATSFDEMPQLLNVLIGQMSLVGPRPFVPNESAGIDGWAARRFDVRPGMTGLWQISGRSDLPFDELRQLDYAYVASWSFWWDLKILWQTPYSVLSRRGAY